MPNQNEEMRITPEEIRLIKGLFKDNDAALKIMRKIFLPSFDPDAPLGQAVDMWNVVDVTSMPAEDVKVYFTARRNLIMHVESMLLQLRTLANLPEESEEEKKSRLEKNSSK